MMSNTTNAPLTTTSTGPSMAIPVSGLVSNNALTSTGLPLPGHNSGMTGLVQPQQQSHLQHGASSGLMTSGIPHLPGTDAMLPPVESHITLPAPILAPGQAPALLHGSGGHLQTAAMPLATGMTTSSGLHHDQHHLQHGTTGHHMGSGLPHTTTTTTSSTTTSNMPLAAGMPMTGHLAHNSHSGLHSGSHASTTEHHGSHGSHHTASHASTTSTSAGAHHPTMMEKIKAHLPGHHGTAASTTSHTADHHTTDKHLLAEREKESHRLAKEQEKLAKERSKEGHHGHHLGHHDVHQTTTGVVSGNTAMPLATTVGATPMLATGAPLAATHHTTAPGLMHTGAGMHTTGAHLQQQPILATGHAHSGSVVVAPDAVLQSGSVAPGAISHTHHIHATALPSTTTTTGMPLMGASTLPHTHTTGAPHLLGGEQKKEYRQDLVQQPVMVSSTAALPVAHNEMHTKTGLLPGSSAQPVLGGHGVSPLPGSYPSATTKLPGTGLMAGQGGNPLLGDGHNAAVDIAKLNMGGQPGMLGAGHMQPIGTTGITGAPQPVIAGTSQVGAVNLADPPRHVF